MPKSPYASVADVLVTAWEAHAAARAVDGVETASDASAALDVAAFEAVRLAFSHPGAPKFFAALSRAIDRLPATASSDEDGDEDGDAASPADEQLTDASEEDEAVALDVSIGDPALPPVAPTGATEQPEAVGDSDSDEADPVPAVDEGAMLPETAYSSLTVSASERVGARGLAAQRVAELRAL